MQMIQRIRKIAQHKNITNLSHRKIAELVGCTHPTVSRDCQLLKSLNLNYAMMCELDDDQLLQLVKPNFPIKSNNFVEPDWMDIANQMQVKHQTLYNLWCPYKAQHQQKAYAYSTFCEKFKKHCKVNKLEARLEHPPGEEAQFDYCGQTVPLWKNAHQFDRKVSIFVGVMCHSKYFLAYATYGQTTNDWIEGQQQFFYYIGGVPRVGIPDNPKSLVTKPRPNLVLNKVYEAFATHVGFVIIPARPKEPQDKGIVEQTARLVTERVLVNMQNIKFTSLEEINAYLKKACDKLNALRFQKRKTSRLALFQEFDKPALNPLPDKEFIPIEQAFAQVCSSNGRIVVGEHFYSVPWTWSNKPCEVRVTKNNVTILHGHKKPVVHQRSKQIHGETIEKSHLHPRYQSMVLMLESEFVEWAKAYGKYTQSFISLQFAGETEKSVSANQRCKAIQGLARKYTVEELESACQYCHTYEHKTPTQLKQVLSSGIYLSSQITPNLVLTQGDNVRGAGYYAK